MASPEVSIKQLPTITSIESGDFVIVQTTNATNKLDFKDFIIGLENATFGSTVTQNTTNIDALSSVLYGTVAATPAAYTTGAIHGVPITIGGTNYNIMLSATS